MHEWIGKWQELYESVWHSPTKQSESTVNELEDMAQQLLNTWGTMDEALQVLKHRVLELGPQYKYQTAGTLLYDQHDYNEALRQLRIEEVSGEAENIRHLYIGYASLYVEKLDDAKASFYYILQASRDSFIIHFAYKGLGLIEMIGRNAEKAILYLEKANCLAENPDVVYNLGICYYWLKGYDHAASCLHQYAITQNDVDVLFILGLALFKNERMEEARGVWLDYADQIENEAKLVALAKLTEWYGEHELSCYCYEQLMLIKGKTPEMLHGFAWNKALLGDLRAIDLLGDLGENDADAKQSWLLLQAAVKTDGNGQDPVN